MSVNGEPLRWDGRVVSADALGRALNGHRELIVPRRAVVTPLALERLRESGVSLHREDEGQAPPTRATWGYAEDRPHPMVRSAVQALRRDGVVLKELAFDDNATCRWAKSLAECVAGGECAGGVIFCQDPGVVCCVANKLAGLRAAAVATVAQAGQLLLALAPNLVAVEMPGRTYFEIRQILRTLCGAALPCPDSVACTLKELDGHAHR